MADDYDFSGLSQTEGSEGSGTPPRSPAPASVGTNRSPETSTEASRGDGDHDTSGLHVLDQDKYNESVLQSKYGSLPQEALTSLEGAAQGVIGPLAPYLEEKTGLTTGKDILGRATVNPFLHAGSEALAFGASSFFGDGLGVAGLAGKLGGAAEKILPAIPGIGAGAQLATIAASNELTRMVEGDPNQTLGSAAVSIGLSGVLGGLGGALLETYNPMKAFAQNRMRAKASGYIASIMGEGAALVAGMGVGKAIPIPGLNVLGGFVAERALAPIFSALAKPFASKLAGSAAAEAAYDYVYAANAGQKTVTNVVKSLFAKSVEGLSVKDLVPPSDSEREKLQAYLLKQENNPEVALNTGSEISHYLPDHATEAASLSARAINYFNSLRPNPSPPAPLDKAPPVDKGAEYKYNRALDMAQKPLLAIKHIENGTLLPEDVNTIQTLYPGLHDSIVKNLTSGIVANKEAVEKFSYAKKQSMNLFMGGRPMFATMTPMSMQSIIRSSGGNTVSSQGAPEGGGRHRSPASGSTLSQMQKVNDLYRTPLQSRAASRAK